MALLKTGKRLLEGKSCLVIGLPMGSGLGSLLACSAVGNKIAYEECLLGGREMWLSGSVTDRRWVFSSWSKTRTRSLPGK